MVGVVSMAVLAAVVVFVVALIVVGLVSDKHLTFDEVEVIHFFRYP